MSNPSELDILITSYRHAEQRVKDLDTLYSKPVCGIPGFGFKAARRANATRKQASEDLAYVTRALRCYVTETKLSKERRTKRLQTVQAVIPTFTLE